MPSNLWQNSTTISLQPGKTDAGMAEIPLTVAGKSDKVTMEGAPSTRPMTAVAVKPLTTNQPTSQPVN